MDDKMEPIVRGLVVGLFSDDYSDVFEGILDELHITDPKTRVEVVDTFQELVEEALADKR